MDTIRVMYTFHELNWLADSPDLRELDGSILIAGGNSYEEAREQVDGVIPWALERDDIVVEHFVHESSLPKLLAEQKAAEAKQPVAPTAR
jgi:hypothetical protein